MFNQAKFSELFIYIASFGKNDFALVQIFLLIASKSGY